MNILHKLSHKKIALDSSCFIYFFEGTNLYKNTLKKTFKAFEKNKACGFCSTLTLTELLPAPIKKNDLELISLYRELEKSPWHIKLIPLTTEIAISAGELRAKYNLRTPDSIHLATAQNADADFFLTNDSRLRKISSPRVEILADFT